MVLIADSGSTKTDWCIIENQQVIRHIRTVGINPVLMDTELIIKELRLSFKKIAFNKKVKEIYYYGAGCWDAKTCTIVQNALKVLFPKAAMEVTNDLLGAARAVCGSTKGIACILGTGANSCLYDGNRIIDNVPALGFIMGDEGSGADLGKRLLQSYFYRALPNDLKEKLDAQFAISKKILLEKVYANKGGNQYLASFAKFIIQEKAHPFLQQLIIEAFNNFVKKQVLKYDLVYDLPIHFIGSIAFLLKHELQEVLAKNGLVMGKVIRQPIDGLLDFHQKQLLTNSRK